MWHEACNTDGMTEHHTRPSVALSRAGRTLLATAVLAGSIAFAPLPAVASRLSTDRVGGVRLSSSQVATSTAPDITARSGVLVGSGGQVLWSRKSRTKRPMASTTKLMTALLVLENADLDETVRVSRAAARTPYALGLRTGEKRSVRKLLELTLVASSNDAASALAIHVAGSRSAFVRMMNARAAELGMADTRFANPHGLDAKGHYSSASDLNLLTRTAIAYPEFRRIIRMRSVVLPRHRTRPARRVKSTDELLGRVVGLRGGKTGYTGDARYCFTASARRDGVTLTSVVLDSPSSSSRFTSSKRLLEWGFKHFRVHRLATAGGSVGEAPLSGVTTGTVPAQYAATKSLPVLGLLGGVARDLSFHETLTVPVFSGQQVGVVRFVQNASVLTTVAAVASRPVASVEETVGTVPVLGRDGQSVLARAAASTATVAPYDVTRPVERSVDLATDVMAPVLAGQLLGQITYSQDGRVLVVVPAVAAYSVVGPDVEPIR